MVHAIEKTLIEDSQVSFPPTSPSAAPPGSRLFTVTNIKGREITSDAVRHLTHLPFLRNSLIPHGARDGGDNGIILNLEGEDAPSSLLSPAPMSAPPTFAPMGHSSAPIPIPAVPPTSAQNESMSPASYSACAPPLPTQCGTHSTLFSGVDWDSPLDRRPAVGVFSVPSPAVRGLTSVLPNTPLVLQHPPHPRFPWTHHRPLHSSFNSLPCSQNS